MAMVGRWQMGSMETMERVLVWPVGEMMTAWTQSWRAKKEQNKSQLDRSKGPLQRIRQQEAIILLLLCKFQVNVIIWHMLTLQIIFPKSTYIHHSTADPFTPLPTSQPLTPLDITHQFSVSMGLFLFSLFICSDGFFGGVFLFFRFYI